MTNNTCARPPELYQGDGSTTKYSFSFPYLKSADIAVFLWNDTTKEFDKCTLVDANACTGSPTEYYFENSTPVELTFCVAPGLPPADRLDDFSNVIIGRETDICQMVAYFYPGTSIRAQDLNNDFTQILLAIQDIQGGVYKALEEYNEFVRRSGDTMAGPLDMDENRLTGVPTPDLPSDAVPFGFLEQYLSGDTATVRTTRYREVCTAGQTVVNVTPAFAIGNELVFINGAEQSRNVDYITPKNTEVVFSEPLLSGDIVDVVSYNNLLLVESSADFEAPPFSRNAFIATDGQTAFSCPEEYTVGKEQVFFNGALLKRDVDYIAQDKVNVTLTMPALVGDLVEVQCSNYFATGIAPFDPNEANYTYPGGTVQTLQDRLEQSISVVDFGAVGDGVTDDTAAIQAAIQSAVANKTRVVIPFDTTINLYPAKVNPGELVDHLQYCGYKLTIHFTTGCVLEEQIIADHKDASWIKLTGDDAFTPVVKTSFTRTILDGSDARKPLIGADHGSTPAVHHRFHFDAADKGTKGGFQGICAFNNSSAFVAAGAGITNSPDVGIFASNCSTVVCSGAIVEACSIGLMAFKASSIEAESCVISNCYWYGVYVNRNSHLNFQYGSITYTAGDNARIIRCSTFNADNSVITHAGKKFDGSASGVATTNTNADMVVANPNEPAFANIYCLSSTVRSLNSTLTYAQKHSFRIDESSNACIKGSDLSNSGSGALIGASQAELKGCTINNIPLSALTCANGATVNAENLVTDNAGGSATGGATLWARTGSTLNAANAIITNSIAVGGMIYSQEGSSVNFVGGTMTATAVGGNPIPFYGVRAENLSSIALDGVDARRDKTAASDQDISISRGGIISSVGAISNGNCAFAANVPTANGIVYSDRVL